MPQVQFIQDDSERDARQQAARALQEGLTMGMAFRQQALQEELSTAQLQMAQEKQQFDIQQARKLEPLEKALLQSQIARQEAGTAQSLAAVEHGKWEEGYLADEAERRTFEAQNQAQRLASAEKLNKTDWMVTQFFVLLGIKDPAQRAQATELMRSVVAELGDKNVSKLFEDVAGPVMTPDEIVMNDLGRALENNPELKLAMLSLMLRAAYPTRAKEFSVEQLALMSEEERKQAFSQVEGGDETDVILGAMRGVLGIEVKGEETDEGTDEPTVELNSAYPVPDELLPKLQLRTKKEKEVWTEKMSNASVQRASTAIYGKEFIPTAGRFFKMFGQDLKSPEKFHNQPTGLTARQFGDHFVALVGTQKQARGEVSPAKPKAAFFSDIGLPAWAPTGRASIPAYRTPGVKVVGTFGQKREAGLYIDEVIEYVEGAEDPREALGEWLTKQSTLEENGLESADINMIKFVMWAGKVSRVLD